ncbi:unnamed protein product [Brassica napus]|uniref:non-specific serine/threonine protein kinase n=1 Tax=Brassica napus TaxID=3708 RepID=A0A817BFV0_BRANA|nr:unnamed protein product [Brassica napus]
MFFKLHIIIIILFNLLFQSSSQILNFTYNGFPQRSDISIKGIATVTPNGVLRLTNTTLQQTGHAFYNKSIRLKNSPNSTVYSFSTTFVFAIHPRIPGLSGHGIAFVISPNKRLPYATPNQYMGLFNITNDGNKTNHVFAIELDTIRSTEFNDINDNHVGIDINSLTSVESSPAGWWDKKGQFKNLTLISRKPMQVWVDYNGPTRKIDVTMAPFNEDKPKKPLVSIVRDLSPTLLQDMFVGFSSATGSVQSEHYILGWSFGVNREAPPLDLSKLPKLPPRFRLMKSSLAFYNPEVTLDWKQRIKVILGVASGLLYLHEEWEQVVIHKDVKASNVMLDGELNGRLSDFGLARLCDHGTDPQTTRIVGTLGYLAPEYTRTGRATTATDVFAFGAFLLEVVCGKRPIQTQHESGEAFLLVDWVFGLWNMGNILDAKDPNMGSVCDEEEVEMVLTLGLLCSHFDPFSRPSMRQILYYLRGDEKLSDLSLFDLSTSGVQDRISGLGTLYSSSPTRGFTNESVTNSLVSSGR